LVGRAKTLLSICAGQNREDRARRLIGLRGGCVRSQAHTALEVLKDLVANIPVNKPEPHPNQRLFLSLQPNDAPRRSQRAHSAHFCPGKRRCDLGAYSAPPLEMSLAAWSTRASTRP